MPTLSSQTLLARIKAAQQQGYQVRLIYIFVPDVQQTIARVALRHS